jgi:inorganic pyrophosphatase
MAESYEVPVKTLGRSTSHGSNSNLQAVHEGEGLNYRMNTVDKAGGKKNISLWHDVTLVHVDPVTNKPTPYLNFVNEIPKFSR